MATDHVIESFRNDMWAGYKSSAGMPRELLAQFPLVEDGAGGGRLHGLAAGRRTRPTTRMAAAAVVAAADPRVERVIICTPDKDLGQCVGGKVVQLDRRKDSDLRRRRGRASGSACRPRRSPTCSALVGDTADGFPGLPGWGAKSAAAVLRPLGPPRGHPRRPDHLGRRRPGRRQAQRHAARPVRAALLFRRIATVETDAPVSDSVDELRWTGPPDPTVFAELCEMFGAPRLAERAQKLAAKAGA